MTKQELLVELRDIIERSPGGMRGYIDAHSAANIAARKKRALEIIATLESMT